MNFTIEEFWKKRFQIAPAETTNPQPGWVSAQLPLGAFVEAPLVQSGEFGTADPDTSPLILVSAPGAVGKSTLAKQIAALTGAIYVDLATAEPVGGNFLSGGLAKSGLFGTWQANTTAVLIDGLDEARIRVTQGGFESFLGDVVQMAKTRSAQTPVPTVLFGRTGAIQDTWLLLSEAGVNAPVMEIGFYPPAQSIEFALARVRDRKPDRSHEGPEREALTLLLERLKKSTSRDGDRFAGYAPVLMAVADRVAGEANPSGLIAEIKGGGQPVTLETVVDAILEREHAKLGSLEFTSSSLHDQLYTSGEQLDRICARVYGQPAPALPKLSPQDAKTYGQALDTWVPEHPFLDGTAKPSSAVFEARIAVHALQSKEFEEQARRVELPRGTAANPFLADFYLNSKSGQTQEIRPEHLGILYSSIRATLALGDTASLQIEPLDEDAQEEDALSALAEISVERGSTGESHTLELKTQQVGTIHLSPHVEDVNITLQLAKVEVGPGAEITFVAPVNIQCGQLLINAERVIVEALTDDPSTSVYLESNSSSGTTVSTVPTIRGNTSLSVAWPNSAVFPWTSFSANPAANQDPRIEEGLRRLRKFVIAFRSHSKGSLRRYRDKLDHARMTKGVGQAILDALKQQGIITVVGEMYDLNADALGAKVGATYAECMSRQFSPRTVEFVETVLKAD